MSNPKDGYKDIFGSEPDNIGGPSEEIDLDELLRSIDRELGESGPADDPHLLDYDFYNDIFGSKKDIDIEEYKKLYEEPKAPSEKKTEDTGVIKKEPGRAPSKSSHGSRMTMPDKSPSSQDTIALNQNTIALNQSAMHQARAPKTFTQETKAIPSMSEYLSEPVTLKKASPDDSAKSGSLLNLAKEKLGKKEEKKAAKERKSVQDIPDGGNDGKRFRLTGVRYFLFILVTSVILAYLAWISVNDMFGLNKPPVSATITVPQNFTMKQVTDELKKAGIIQYKFLFGIFGAIANADEKIDPGSYVLTSDLDYRAIISEMQAGGSNSVVKVTILEGDTLAEIFAALESKGVCKAAKLADAATNYDFEYKFLDSSTVGNSKRLEGYLFPDTYQFYVDESAQTVIEKFLDNFDSKVTADMYAQAKKLGYSMADIIKVASLVEKESANDIESPKVASVIYNRLKSSSFPYLQIDASVQYALPQRKAKLTNDDLKVDSPYNTYTHKGLPPTPISNPGLTSIYAALNPTSTDYYFYALNKNGTHNFFTSSKDFDAFVSSSNYGG